MPPQPFAGGFTKIYHLLARQVEVLGDDAVLQRQLLPEFDEALDGDADRLGDLTHGRDADESEDREDALLTRLDVQEQRGPLTRRERQYLLPEPPQVKPLLH